MNSIIINNIEFKRSSIAPRVFISSKGFYILPFSKEPEKIRMPSRLTNKYGYPTQAAICTTVQAMKPNGDLYAKRAVFNAGRLVLDAWMNQVQPDLTVDHIDGNPYNNDMHNLQFLTQADNTRKSSSNTPEAIAFKQQKRDQNAIDKGYKSWSHYMAALRAKHTEEDGIDYAANRKAKLDERAKLEGFDDWMSYLRSLRKYDKNNYLQATQN